MGIKFKGSNVSGKIPLASDIGEREIGLNTKDGKIFTSDGTNIIEIITPEVGGIYFDATVDYKKDDTTSYNGSVYMFITDTPAAPWDPTKVTYVGGNNLISETLQSSYIPDFESTRYFKYTLTEDTTIEEIVNGNIGDEAEILIIQDAVGGWNLTFNQKYLFGLAGTDIPVVMTGAYESMLFKLVVLDDNKVSVEYVSSYNANVNSPYDTIIQWA